MGGGATTAAGKPGRVPGAGRLAAGPARGNPGRGVTAILLAGLGKLPGKANGRVGYALVGLAAKGTGNTGLAVVGVGLVAASPSAVELGPGDGRAAGSFVAALGMAKFEMEVVAGTGTGTGTAEVPVSALPIAGVGTGIAGGGPTTFCNCRGTATGVVVGGGATGAGAVGLGVGVAGTWAPRVTPRASSAKSNGGAGNDRKVFTGNYFFLAMALVGAGPLV